MTTAVLNSAGRGESKEVTITLTRRPSGNKCIVSFLYDRGHFQFRAAQEQDFFVSLPEGEGGNDREEEE